MDRVGADALSLRSVAKTVRVDIRKLDHLMNIVGELAIVRSAVSQLTERLRTHPELRYLSTELHRIARSFERHLAELQDGILEVRMVPLGQVFDKLARVVRQVARDATQGDPPRGHRRRDRGRQADRRGALRSAHAHDPQRHRSRHRAGRTAQDARQAAGRHARAQRLPEGQPRRHRGEDDGAGIDPAKLHPGAPSSAASSTPTRRARCRATTC